MKILVADDHQIVRYGLRLVLRSIWPKVIILEAEDLDTAVNLISGNNISLIIFDVNMPGAEKLEEVIRIIVKETRVVVFSGYDKSNRLTNNHLATSADVFVFKDSSLAQIKEMFSSLVIKDVSFT